MNRLLAEKIRPAAMNFLHSVTDLQAPAWRICMSEQTSEVTAVAPVCPDPDHDEHDAGLWSCCPDPVVECDSLIMAEYIAALLNADRG